MTHISVAICEVQNYYFERLLCVLYTLSAVEWNLVVVNLEKTPLILAYIAEKKNTHHK